jgi:hypothetical protein
MSDFKILDYKSVAKTLSSVSRKKTKTEKEIYQQIASKLKELVESGKRRAFVFLPEQNAFYLTVKYGNRVAYVVQGEAKTEDEGKASAFQYLDALARQDIEAAEKGKLKKAIGKLTEQTVKAREGRAAKKN